MHLLLLVLFSFFCVARDEVQANPRCPSGWEWARNSLNQDPCGMLVLLESQCRRIRVQVPSLNPPDTVSYTPPSSGSYSAQCECNVPVFNILQACVECQDGNITTWRFWTKECPSVDEGLPFSVPQGSAIPRWAFAGNVETDFIFLAALAMSIGRDPEATPETTSSSTVATSDSSILTSSPPATVSPISTSSLSEPEPTDAPGGDDKKHRTSTGAIIGASLGVTAFLAGMAVLIYFLLQSRRRKKEALSQIMLKTPPPVSQMPGPSAYMRTNVSPVIPLQLSPELPSFGSRSRRLIVTNPSESPTSSNSTPPTTSVLGGPGGTDMCPG